MHKDYRVFELTVEGGPGDSLDDVQEVFREEETEAIDNVEALKRLDFELDQEFEVDRHNGGRGSMHQ